MEFTGAVSKTCVPGKDPLQCDLPTGGGARGKREVSVLLELQGHYGEPSVDLKFKLTPGTGNVDRHKPHPHHTTSCDNHVTATVDVFLSYNPSTGQWTIRRSPDDQVEKTVEKVTEKLEAAKV